MLSGATKLSSSMTVAKYKDLEKAGDRKSLAHFIQQRFEERYFSPVEDSPSKNGFASLAVSCLVIEALESFYQGKASTKDSSKQMFRDFFERDTPLKVFASHDDWFYYDIRCGILHQAEARNGWRVLRNGSLLDCGGRTINATRFLRALRRTVAEYAQAITADDTLWGKFQLKMEAVCDNCVPCAGRQ